MLMWIEMLLMWEFFNKDVANHLNPVNVKIAELREALESVTAEQKYLKARDTPSPMRNYAFVDFNNEDQRPNDIVGCAYYVAPEVLHRSYNKEADMWTKKIGPLEIVEKINSNAYRLKLPSHIRCSDVFNVKHLLPYHGDSSDDDPVVNSRANFVYPGENDAGPSIEERAILFLEAQDRGDGSSSNEWRDYGMAGNDYEGPPVFDDDQYEEESMPLYDTDIEDVIEEEE
ncbi:putative reverse transcriptase domain-containing protein [Tanacetum coccineum]|uniref:Reverse transcriptase domain-containing protein n=1 Tax=Tanacetum coccineum TaxID=301880 RepID=A0ABQ4WG18_9ASTR